MALCKCCCVRVKINNLLHKTKKDAIIVRKTIVIKDKYKILLKQRRLINNQLKELKYELSKIRRNSIDSGIYMDDMSADGVSISIEDDVSADGVSISIEDDVSADGVSISIEDDVSADEDDVSADVEGVSADDVEGFDASYKCKAFLLKVKQCPQCNEYINKDEGCDIIKCINCNTIFNWKTKIIIDNNQFPNMNILEPALKISGSCFNEDDIIKIKGIYEHVIEFIRYKMKTFINILSSMTVSGEDKYKTSRIDFLNNKINQSKFYKKLIKISKFENYRVYIIRLILLAYQKAVNIFSNSVNKESLVLLEDIINNTNNTIINITKYLKYSNNIKFYQWFNLNDESKLLH